MENKKVVLRIAVPWSIFFLLIGWWYYSLTGYDNPKVALIFEEIFLTVLLACLLLMKDIKEINDIAVVPRPYIDDFQPASRSRSEIINSLMTGGHELFLLVLSVLVTVFFIIMVVPSVQYFFIKVYMDELSFDLVLKTLISIHIAFGCVLVFGKITLQYAINRIREFSVIAIDSLEINPDIYEDNNWREK